MFHTVRLSHMGIDFPYISFLSELVISILKLQHVNILSTFKGRYFLSFRVNQTGAQKDVCNELDQSCHPEEPKDLFQV
jgi:hypothetical protein